MNDERGRPDLREDRNSLKYITQKENSITYLQKHFEKNDISFESSDVLLFT